MSSHLGVEPLSVTLSAEASNVIRAVAAKNHLSVHELTSLAVMTGLENTDLFMKRFEEWLEDRRDKGCEDVYAVEGKLLRRGKQFKAIADAQRYVDTVCASRWWRQYFAATDKITVKRTRSRKAAYIKVGSTDIYLPLWGRKQMVVLHEMTHLVQPDGSQSHGPEYTRLYCDLVREEMGCEIADRLMAGLRERQVRIGQSERVYSLCALSA